MKKTDVLTPEQILISIVFSAISGLVSGLVYFLAVVLLGSLLSFSLDFSEVSITLVVSYMLINILGIFVALVVRMVFLKLVGYQYNEDSIVNDISSLLYLSVFLFVLSLPMFFYLISEFNISFPILVLGFYLFFNFVTALFMSESKEHFIGVLISMFICFFVFFGLFEAIVSSAMVFLIGVFLFPMLILGVSELFVGIYQFVRVVIYRTYGVWIGR